MEARGPLPADPRALYRLCGAQDDEERTAIDRVSGEFFKNGDGHIRHKRCDEELANREKQEAMRRASASHAAGIRWASGTVCGKMPDSDSDSDSSLDSNSKPDSKPTPTSKALRPPPAKKPRGAAPTAEVWASYCTAYFGRYGTEPVRNATINGQLANFVSRIGATEAPAVAASYLRNDGRAYLKAGHSVGMMLHDAEKLRTEWATGNISGGSAGNPFERMLRERKNAEA